MLNESILLLSFDELKDLFLHELTILNAAFIYVFSYVIYKALGRYVYFKPQEHASKVNRTFLTLSLLAIFLHGISGLVYFLPFLPEHRWFYVLCILVIFTAPLSIIMDRFIWKYDSHGNKTKPNWHYDYLKIPRDYYRTSAYKTQHEGNHSSTWEEEVVESTSKNIHSDALLNILAPIVFVSIGMQWANESALLYGYFSYLFSAVTCLTIVGMFVDHTLFSWIDYFEKKVKKLFKK